MSVQWRRQITVAACGLALILGGASAGLPAGTHPAHADGTVRYVVVDLGSLDPGTESYATGINASGQVSGYARPSTPGVTEHAFRFTDGVGMQDLDSRDADATFGYIYNAVISDNGQVAGTYQVPGPGPRPYVFTDAANQVTDLGVLGGNFGSVNGANGAGEVVGQAENAFGVSLAAAWISGFGAEDLNAGLSTPQMLSAYGVNNSGQVTGELLNSHAFIYSGGNSVEDLGSLTPDGYSVGYAINAGGVVVGTAVVAGGLTDAFIYTNGMVDLGQFGGRAYNTAYAINDNGIVVGDSYTGGYPDPFIYDSNSGGALQDLNSLVDPAQHWHLETARGINNSGQIAGWGVNPNGVIHAYRLDPITGSPAESMTSLSSTQPLAAPGQSVTFNATVRPVTGSGTPTGQVTFTDGSTVLATVYMVAGKASFTTSALPAGTQSISASYSGDPNYRSSESAPLQESVGSPSSTLLTATTNPSVSGQAASFKVTVTGSGSTPTGTVSLSEGATSLDTQTLDSSGAATLTAGSLGLGSHTLIASYSGDGTYAPSTSGSVQQQVNQASSTTTLSASQNPSAAGQAVTFTAQVSAAAPGSGTPAGSVTFAEGAAVLDSETLDGSGSASFTTSALAAGNHTITAEYSGSSAFSGSASNAVVQQVTPATSSTLLFSLSNPSTFAESVTLVAEVSAGVSGGGIPTGQVIFTDGPATLGSVTLDSSGTAIFTTDGLTAGSHTLVATYVGDATFPGSSSDPLNQLVNRASTATNLTSSANPSTPGQPVTFTIQVNAGGVVIVSAASVGPRSAAAATVTNPTVPTGQVTLMDGSASLGTVTLDSTGAASFTTSALSTGTHTISAQYSGDANYLASTSPAVSQVVGRVGKAPSALTLTTSANPVLVGQPVTFTALVNGGTAGIPTGIVTFKDGNATIGTITLLNGVATLTTNSLGAGRHTIRASYGGDGTFRGSALSLSQTVVKNATTAVLTSSLNPSSVGQNVTFSAAVKSSAGGMPTGMVTFMSGGKVMGTALLDTTGTATFSTTTLTAGVHTVIARYAGDGMYASSVAAPLRQVTTRLTSAVTLASSANPSLHGQPVTFTAQVSGAGVLPTGSVTFKIGGTIVGMVALDGTGTATCTAGTLSSGNRTVTAVYGGDGTYSGSRASLVQAVQ